MVAIIFSKSGPKMNGLTNNCKISNKYIALKKRANHNVQWNHEKSKN